MKVLDEQLDNKPTEKAVTDMAESRIRNLQCFEELKSFNETGKWKNIHPLLINQSDRFRLEELRKKDPTAFLKEYANCEYNVKRYSSFLKNDERKDRRKSDKSNLMKHKTRLLVFQDIISNS